LFLPRFTFDSKCNEKTLKNNIILLDILDIIFVINFNFKNTIPYIIMSTVDKLNMKIFSVINQITIQFVIRIIIKAASFGISTDTEWKYKKI